MTFEITCDADVTTYLQEMKDVLKYTCDGFSCDGCVFYNKTGSLICIRHQIYALLEFFHHGLRPNRDIFEMSYYTVKELSKSKCKYQKCDMCKLMKRDKCLRKEIRDFLENRDSYVA